MSLKTSLHTDSSTWRAMEEYAAERTADLSMVCTSPESTDQQIRQAQAGILEMQRLQSLPQMILAESQIRGQKAARKEY